MLQAAPPIQGHGAGVMTPSKCSFFPILLVVKDIVKLVIKMGSQLWRFMRRSGCITGATKQRFWKDPQCGAVQGRAASFQGASLGS